MAARGGGTGDRAVTDRRRGRVLRARRPRNSLDGAVCADPDHPPFEEEHPSRTRQQLDDPDDDEPEAEKTEDDQARDRPPGIRIPGRGEPDDPGHDDGADHQGPPGAGRGDGLKNARPEHPAYRVF